jgi:hypothetical protein
MSPRDFTKNVFIRAYRTMLRSGWEDGLTYEEMAKELLAVLKNMEVSDHDLFKAPMPVAAYHYPPEAYAPECPVHPGTRMALADGKAYYHDLKEPHWRCELWIGSGVCGKTLPLSTKERLREYAKNDVDSKGEARAAMVFAWVIEKATSEPSRPEYFTGKSTLALQWSDPGDHAEACRFSRQQDAQRFADGAWPGHKHRVCEHGWEE